MTLAIGLFHVLKKLHINKIYGYLEDYLPARFIARVNSWADTFGFTPLVIFDEINPQFKRAASFMKKYLGARPIGDYLEFGVCHGTSMVCMFNVLNQFRLKNVRLFGFDSFEALPSRSEKEKQKFEFSAFASTLEQTTRFLSKSGIDWKRTFLVKGWYSETLGEHIIRKHRIEKASIVMIDCDTYSSAKEALFFCAPLIKDRTIIFLDDWGTELNSGEPKAFDEFLKANQHLKAEKFGTYKPYGQIFLLTNTLAY